MPLEIDLALRQRGTRFRLFPQSPVLSAFQEPETVWVSPPPGTILPGPADDRMYVVDAINKPAPYEFPDLPPYSGPLHNPVYANRSGHFDHLEYGSREFQAAHMYGTLRRVLDIWESYFQAPIQWHFANTQARMELVPWLDWDNAQSGFGFIETGFGKDENGLTHPYCLNFDVLAHELGHSLLFSAVGIPTDETMTAEYRGFQESSADMVALISVLHFDSFVRNLLDSCAGNLYAENELNRIGELSDTEQIRIASNSFRMSDVVDADTPAQQLSQPELHRLGEPLTGALFDLLVAIYQETLVEENLIPRELNEMSRSVVEHGEFIDPVQSQFTAAYVGNEAGFESALLLARDHVGYCLAAAWKDLGPDYLIFSEVEQRILDADRRLSGGRYRESILEVFDWREIRPANTRRYELPARQRVRHPASSSLTRLPRKHSIRSRRIS